MSVTLPMTRTPAASAGSAHKEITTAASAAIKICFFMTRSFRANNTNALSMGDRAGHIRQRIFYASRFEGTQAQDTTVANAASFALFSVTRPGQLQGRA